MQMDLIQLGWHPFFEACFDEHKQNGLVPGRIARENRNNYLILTADGDLLGEVSGKFRHNASRFGDFPAVGDWVALSPRFDEGRGTIQAVLPRRTKFSRKAVLSGGMPETGGQLEEQVMAANIDTAFLVTGLDNEFNPRRLERYVTIAWDSGAAPVVILNKIDLIDDPDEYVRTVEEIAVGVPVLTVSALNKTGLNSFADHFKPGQTAVFLGSSGTGKSTIINGLLGDERQLTREVREYDSRGRHTTTSRELIVIPDSGIVIDTPGLREIAAFDDSDGLSKTFDDIECLAQECRFNDCTHNTEPGCAVRKAIEEGRLSPGRLENYRKMQKEAAYLALRRDQRARIKETEKWKKITKMIRVRTKIDPKLK